MGLTISSCVEHSRSVEGGFTYLTLNQANTRLTFFEDAPDRDAFVRVLAEAVTRFPVELFVYCVMPDHFQLVFQPAGDGALSRAIAP